MAVTYWMNRLQHIDRARPLFVSLNPPFAPASELTFGRYDYDHSQRRALNGLALARACLLLPLVTFKIMVAIHWQALRLWLKGAKIVPRPSMEPSEPALVRTGTPSGLSAVPD